MRLVPTPVRMDTPLTIERQGDTLVFNGQPVDLAAPVPCDWIVGEPVLGPEGWQVGIILPHAHNAPTATRWPAPIDVTEDGPVALPPFEETEVS